eukprot:TRINITY_DN16697_c0_g1_i1.p1 TRINITY_DN16697_c0_g1~~TRINITY_DN16697_c0_g1_i1.p1  ORF type:complete len:283 (-),score=9.70 TRINITY_DN16697_c0_g1_i1:109-957(-)
MQYVQRLELTACVLKLIEAQLKQQRELLCMNQSQFINIKETPELVEVAINGSNGKHSGAEIQQCQAHPPGLAVPFGVGHSQDSERTTISRQVLDANKGSFRSLQIPKLETQAQYYTFSGSQPESLNEKTGEIASMKRKKMSCSDEVPALKDSFPLENHADHQNWKRCSFSCLKERRTAALRLDVQGGINSEIANKTCTAVNFLRKHNCIKQEDCDVLTPPERNEIMQENGIHHHDERGGQTFLDNSRTGDRLTLQRDERNLKAHPDDHHYDTNWLSLGQSSE